MHDEMIHFAPSQASGRPSRWGVGSLVLVAALTGCSTGKQAVPVTTPGAQGKLIGHARGGQNPITGATIQLWRVNTATDGGAGTAMLTTTVTSSDGTGVVNANANAGNLLNTLPAGDFTITGQYVCPVGDALVFITASGGNPGLSAGTNNPQSQLVTAVGSCDNLKNVQYVEISEQTTMGTVAALNAFMTAYNAIGSTPAHAADLNAQFGVVNEYIDFQAGAAPGPALPAGYYASTGNLNDLADVLSGCVNSAGVRRRAEPVTERHAAIFLR
jgi:hypothetical protein